MIIENMPKGYARVLAKVRTEGEWTVSRGLKHKEILGLSVDVTDPTKSLATGTGRGLVPAIGLVEATQLISGESFPRLMETVASGRFKRYMDGEVLHGAYGPRTRPQIERAVERLQRDPGSRQAVITVWDPLHDMQDRRDLPCTVSMQFMVRDEQLHMVTYMRSNDAWLGFPYDVFQFCQLQCTIANILDYTPGTYHHRVGSFHMYEEHHDISRDVESSDPKHDEPYEGIYATDWHDAQEAALAALNGDVIEDGRLVRETAALVNGR